jgi:hypothetical protein
VSTTSFTCTAGQTSGSAVACNNGTIYLPTAGACTFSPTDGSVSYLDFPTTVNCPNATQGAVQYSLRVVSSQYPTGNECGPITQTVYLRNTIPANCTPAVSISCSAGTSSGSPLLCSSTGDPLHLPTAAGCSLSGLGAAYLVSSTNVSCPPSGVTSTVTLYAEASPNYGDAATCGPIGTTLYVRNDRKCGEAGYMEGDDSRARCGPMSQPQPSICDLHLGAPASEVPCQCLLDLTTVPCVARRQLWHQRSAEQGL